MGSKEEISHFLTDAINQFLHDSFAYKRRFAYIYGRTNVMANTRKADLLVRVLDEDIFGANALVIARIYFHSTRKGYGRRFLQMLLKFAQDHGIQNIGIESANPNSRAFGERFGMHVMPPTNCLTGSIETIAKALKT